MNPRIRTLLGGRALVGLAIAAVLALVYFPIVLGQVLFFRDPANWTYPARFFARAAVLAGELPTWNPLQGLGFPTLGNPLYGLFYPPNWLFLLTPESMVVHMVTWQSLGHLIWGGLGMAALLQRLLPESGRREAGRPAPGGVRGGDGVLPVGLPQRAVDGGAVVAGGCLGAVVWSGRADAGAGESVGSTEAHVDVAAHDAEHGRVAGHGAVADNVNDHLIVNARGRWRRRGRGRGRRRRRDRRRGRRR